MSSQTAAFKIIGSVCRRAALLADRIEEGAALLAVKPVAVKINMELTFRLK